MTLRMTIDLQQFFRRFTPESPELINVLARSPGKVE
jgi:hypothetical protein